LDFRTPEELLAIGFTRSRVVMMNEAHNGMKRCVRTREIGLRLLPAAHEAGVRHFAMEALYGPYLRQPDMQQLVQGAEDLGWRLIPYETREWPTDTNRREEEQARNLHEALAAMPPDAPLLVWCGNGHLYKAPSEWQLPDGGRWEPMGYRFWEVSGVEPFAIDQTVTAELSPGRVGPWHELADRERGRLDALGGTAGFLTEASPIAWPCVDAVLLSTQNDVE
jgi:hypothetical protein